MADIKIKYEKISFYCRLYGPGTASEGCAEAVDNLGFLEGWTAPECDNYRHKKQIKDPETGRLMIPDNGCYFLKEIYSTVIKQGNYKRFNFESNEGLQLGREFIPAYRIHFLSIDGEEIINEEGGDAK